MQDAAPRARLKGSLERHLRLLFSGRVLPVTQAIAARWGRLGAMAGLIAVSLTAWKTPVSFFY